MPVFLLTPFDPAEEPLRLEAESHDLEGASHVFRRTALVMGRPRPIVVRRVPAALVARVDVLDADVLDADVLDATVQG